MTDSTATVTITLAAAGALVTFIVALVANRSRRRHSPTVYKDGSVLVLQPRGALIGDLPTDELTKTVQRAVLDGKTHIVIDLNHVKYINSFGLGVLIQLQNLARERGGILLVANVSDRLANVFVITKLDKVLDVTKSLKDAVTEAGTHL